MGARPDCPEFIEATLPPPLQWEGVTIWRVDLKAYQFSNGVAWLTHPHQDPTTGALACAWSGPWAARPALGTVPAKTRIFVTDIPSGIGSVFIAGATTWLPEAGEVVLAQSNVPGTPVTGTTAIVTQPLVTVPGGLLGANGMLILEGTFSYTNNANNKTAQLRFENSGSPVRVFSVTQASIPAHSFVAYLWNRGADNSQSFHYNLAAGIGAGGTFEQSSMNTAVDQTLNAILMLTNAADTMRLERWAVRARPF